MLKKELGINKPPPHLKADIRQAIRIMYLERGRVDSDVIKSRFLAKHPDQENHINNVVVDYAFSLQQGIGKRVEAQSGPPKTNHNQNENTPNVTGHDRNVNPDKGLINDVMKKEDQNGHAILQGLAVIIPFLFLTVYNNGRPSCFTTLTVPSLANQMCFLSSNNQDDCNPKDQNYTSVQDAVLISATARTMPSQFALMGGLSAQQSALPQDPRVMLNTNVPFSAFICGVQGSGKSHTTSCIIENCSLPLPILGALKRPLSTLVLNFNEYSSNVGAQPCEAAFLSSALPEWSKNGFSIPVRILVPPSNFHNLKRMYCQIPNVEVQPFKLKAHHLNISTMLSLMSMGNGDQMPLYMSQVTRVLREMAIENKGGTFDYLDFRRRLEDLNINRMQTPFLHQRLDLLDSYLDLKGEHNGDYFTDGGITILDLSCPFMDQATTCLLFRITIDLFLHAHPSRGKMIVADEAHKYMSETPAAKDLTDTFLNIIRQQRHLGVRTIISTQEPTISPRLIDLCSMTIIHRFTSLSECLDGLHEIARLRTGEALVFAPSAYLLDEKNSAINAAHKVFKWQFESVSPGTEGGQFCVFVDV
ncbi:hypothetical protein BDV27DRAFT_156197 [Aspergillus caelatus]|uniref:Zona occludens toxin N-terminal domain-containing protein n=1 Tax=Aspergillus caelatus TaxID=61420 RepID=A0A5N7AAC3_9EURO|nr:uncharacterized protein BDV27DRAFT_156197 [Aspergillus caelatus]KAE8366116.1 hypothetical protein BDV27DRAFT_156197 [Aspergillus caelatus]